MRGLARLSLQRKRIDNRTLLNGQIRQSYQVRAGSGSRMHDRSQRLQPIRSMRRRCGMCRVSRLCDGPVTGSRPRRGWTCDMRESCGLIAA